MGEVGIAQGSSRRDRYQRDPIPGPLDGQRAREVLEARARSVDVLAAISARRHVDNAAASRARQKRVLDDGARDVPGRIEAYAQCLTRALTVAAAGIREHARAVHDQHLERAPVGKRAMY